MRTFALMMALWITLPVAAQRSKNKTEVIQPVIIQEGVSYSLPRTGIRIIFKAQQMTYVPGPFALYADPMLGIKNVRMQQQTVWEISKVSFDSFTEPDPDNIYKTKNLPAPLLQLTPQGCLAGFNSNASPDGIQMQVSNSFLNKENLQSIQFTNLIQVAASSGRTPVEQRAEEAAALILKCRNARYEIAAGMLDEFHPDGKAYEESLNELEKTEMITLELFTGKSVTEEHTFEYEFIPGAKSVKGEVIFRFDENLGFLAKNDFSGKPVMMEVEKEESLTPAAPAEATSVSSVFYRQPGIGNIRLTRELTLIGTTRMTIAQFGTVLPVPAELLNGTYSIEFHPETGAIKSISKK
jgi:hypothetical protein